MTRPGSSSASQNKGRSDAASAMSTVASIFSGRSGSRRGSRVPSEDGHGDASSHHHTPGTQASLLRSPSLTASDHGSSPGKPLNRHARMKKAMAEAQNDAIGEQTGPESDHPATAGEIVRPDSPRFNMAARAKQREEEGRARGVTDSTNGLGLISGEKPGEGALTIDLLDGDEVVTAEGVPAHSTPAKNGASAPYAPVARSKTDTAVSHDPSISPRTRPSEDPYVASPAAMSAGSRANSLLVPGEQGLGARNVSHAMQGSQSTSALLLDPHHSNGKPRLSRKLSEASSVGAYSESGRDSPTQRKKIVPGKGGIGAAIAGAGAGALGLGYQGLQSLYGDRSTSPAAVAAAAHAASPMIRNASHGQPVDKDFVGDVQGGLYRDPESGEMIERNNATGDASRLLNVSHPRSRAVSEASLAESDASDGLAAAAGFTAAMQGGAGHLPGPSSGPNQLGSAAPSVAVDSSHAEPRSYDGRSPSRDGRLSAPDTASTTGWQHSDVGSQITGFAVASSKRNSEFHALFPTVSDEDYLIEDYGCALVREVFIQGRLYVSEHHICFNANIFGWVTNIVIPFSEIVSVEKRMTALIIPNAIQIATLHHKHTFSSFLGRDTTYDLVANIWKLSHPDVPSSAAATHEMDADSSDESDDGASVTPASSGMASKLRKKLKANKSKDAEAATTKDAKSNGGATADKGDDKGGKGAGGSKEKHPATSCPCEGEKKHLAVTALDTTYPATPEKVYNLLFKNDDFMKNFWTVDEKLFDLEVNEWKDGEGGPTRSFSYIKPLNGSIGPKQTKCNITDETVHVDGDEYITMLTTTRTPEVPSGNSFSVKTRTCITWNGGGNVSKVLVTCATEWTGRSMLKGVIDKASIDGQKQYYKDLDAAIKKHIKDNKEDFLEEGQDPDEVEQTVNGEAEKGAKEETDKGSASTDGSQPEGVLAQILEQAKTVASTVADVVGGALGEASPSMLALGGVVLLLIISNIWALSSSGAGGGQSRDPLDPHRLRSRPSGRSSTTSSSHSALSAEAVEIANAVRDVLRDHLGPMKGHIGAGLVPPTSHHPLSVEQCRGEAASILAELEDMEGRLKRLKEQWEKVVSQDKTIEGAPSSRM
ncbi:hypothetical protein BCV69DRAFT_281065 [Microstroma glucosiphilum]|uniref:VASt domain-containing protein n=1 Tax=Pseudomicrostroma glucosiphilum TaxID=1684307 RepID=A0A316UE05_9BASI|nr:hypothetical protein BCV69DRAFT_281065 [Pseudomicrostroma glucosiphilum]PWN23446.1 hypothetical protein BCV69DRAFT_281065 [Pseudomicrostroma glucosiphilum]